MQSPVDRALHKQSSALNALYRHIEDYFTSALREEHKPLPRLSRDMVVAGLRELAVAASTAERTHSQFAGVAFQRSDPHTYYITKGRCETKRIITRREDITQMPPIETDIASPDHIMSQIYAPSCAYCSEMTGREAYHDTVLSSTRYMDSALAGSFETIDVLGRDIERLQALEKKRRTATGRTHISEQIRQYRAKRKAAAEALHSTIDKVEDVAFLSLRVKESAHPIIGVTLAAAKAALSYEQERSQFYNITAVAAEHTLLRELTHAAKQMHKEGARINGDLRVVPMNGFYHAEADLTYDDVPMSLQIVTSREYLHFRDRHKLHEEKQQALIEKARAELSFDEIVTLLARRAGMKHQQYLPSFVKL